jgi:LPS-assembly lipoprotein
MSLSSRSLRNALIVLALFGASGLAGCTSYTPVYGDNGTNIAQANFQYAKPVNRLDQIIYQELTLKMGRGASGVAPLLEIVTTTSTRKLTTTDVTRPSEQNEAVVTATIKVTSPAGAVVFNTTRSATALYSTDGLGLADGEAQRNAEDNAARELAETIRLTLMGVLGSKLS